MKHGSRSLLALVAAIVAIFAASASAGAATVVNAVTSTGTAGATSLIDSTAGRTLNCTSAGLTASFPGGGNTGTVSNQTFNSCTESSSGAALTFSRTANWTATVNALLTGSQITGVLILITVPLGGAHFSGPLCDFDISGTQAALTAVTATTPPALVSVNTIPVPGTGTLGTALGLRVSNVSGLGCAVLGVRNGDLSRFTGTYRLSTAITGTLR